MSKKLPSVSGKQVVRAQEQIGYAVTRTHGSHHFMALDGKRSVSIPVHANRDIARGTLRSILADVGLSESEFVDLL